MKLSPLLKKIEQLKIRKSHLLMGGLTLFIVFSLFYKFGILKYISLKNEKAMLQEKALQIGEENKRLRQEIDSLQNMDAKIEKVAREKYRMIRKGEKVFVVEEK